MDMEIDFIGVLPGTCCTWPISDISPIHDNRGTIKSPEFYLSWKNNVKFFLEISRLRSIDDCGAWILQVQSCSKITENLNLMLVASIQDKQNDITEELYSTIIRHTSSDRLKAEIELMSESKAIDLFYENGRIVAQLYIYPMPPFDSFNINIIEDKNMMNATYEKSRKKLSIDISSLFLKAASSDVTLSVQGEKFPAHRVILSARSSVFAMMFTHSMKEQITKEVEIVDTQPDIVKEMLRYMYSDNVENLEEHAFELLIIADKYALTALKEKCSNCLIPNISVDNAPKILYLAHKHNVQELKRKSLDIIKKHKIQVIQKPDFQELLKSDVDLLHELFCSLT